MHPKNEALLDRLIEVTENNSATWSETSLADQFVVSLASGSVFITLKHVSILGEVSPCPEYTLSITDIYGHEVDSVSVASTSKISAHTRIEFAKLKRLYSLVSRNVRHVDQTIDALLSDLGENK